MAVLKKQTKPDKPKRKQFTSLKQQVRTLVPVVYAKPAQKTKPAKFEYKTNSVTISHRETVGLLTSGGNTGNNWLTVTSQIVNPSNTVLFPWLSGMTSLYEKFRIHKLRFSIGSAANTAQVGRTYAYYDYDVDDALPTNFLAIMNNYRCVKQQAFKDLNADYDKREEAFKVYNITSGSTVGQINAPAKVVFGSFLTGAAGVTLGELIVEYTIELLIPQGKPVSTSQNLSGEFWSESITSKKPDGSSGSTSSTNSTWEFQQTTRAIQESLTDSVNGASIQNVYNRLGNASAEEVTLSSGFPQAAVTDVVLSIPGPGWYEIIIEKASSIFTSYVTEFIFHSVNDASNISVNGNIMHTSGATYIAKIAAYFPTNAFYAGVPILMALSSYIATGTYSYLSWQARRLDQQQRWYNGDNLLDVSTIYDKWGNVIKMRRQPERKNAMKTLVGNNVPQRHVYDNKDPISLSNRIINDHMMVDDYGSNHDADDVSSTYSQR